MRLAARFLGIVLATLILLFVSKTTFAQNLQNNQVISATPQTNIHLQTQNIMIEVISSMVCQLTGVDPVNPKQQCLGINRKTGRIGFVANGGGAIGLTTELITGTFLIPVHFSDYIAHTSDNFGFPKKSYAQGIGFLGLQPVLGVFTIFRNLSYLLMVFIFVIIGVAIMLRVRIDPRTVMTIQNQIPKLIIGILMITFSYAIAGFMIDIMWVSTYFVVNALAPANVAQHDMVAGSLTQSTPGFANNVFGDRGGLFSLATDAAGATGDLMEQTIHPDNLGYSAHTDNSDCGWNVFCSIGNAIGGTISGIMTMILSWLVKFIVGIIAFLIFAIAILVQLFKLWFALLKCFISVLLDVILAPFWILGGLIPGAGGSIGVGPWLRDLIANLAVFPAVVFLFLVARIIMEGFANSAALATTFNPPLLGNAGGVGAKEFGSLIALGFVLSAPSVVDQIKKALKASGWGGGIGGIGAGAAAAGAFGGSIKNRLYYRDREGNAQGPAASLQRTAARKVYNSRVGTPYRAVKESSLGQTVGKWTDKDRAKLPKDKVAAYDANKKAETAATKVSDSAARIDKAATTISGAATRVAQTPPTSNNPDTNQGSTS